VPDLLIAAATGASDLAVLHYDQQCGARPRPPQGASFVEHPVAHPDQGDTPESLTASDRANISCIPQRPITFGQLARARPLIDGPPGAQMLAIV